MQSIDDRLKYEEELIVLLLLLFASQDPAWFLQPFGPSRSWFYRQIVEGEIPDLARRVADQSQRDMLRELDLDLFDDRRIREPLSGFEDRFAQQLADSLATTHRNWAQKYDEKTRKQESPPDLYPEWKAKRDAITKITEAVSDTQQSTRTALDQSFGIKLQAQWKLDPFSNWCELCLDLRDRFQSSWWQIYPGYPPRHVNCRCGVSYSHWLGDDVPPLDFVIASGRRGVEMAPMRVLDPFERRLAPREAFSRILTTI